MIPYLTLFLVCQLAGEVLVRLGGVPVPGPLVGMAGLFAGLLIRGRAPPKLDEASDGLLRHLSLLFVPAGVGVVVHLKTLSKALVPIAGATLIGTLVAMAVTGLLMQRLGRKEPGP